MTLEEVQNHHRKIHGITADTTYDPEVHEETPAICFGELLPETADLGGQPLIVGAPGALESGFAWTDDPQ